MKIYILEDDPEIQALESYALETSGFKTACYDSGRACMEAMKKEVPALLLLDLMLPEESGLDVLKKIRENPRTAALPVIIVTAKNSEMDTVRGLDLGADDYMTKPFGVMELVSRVKARTRHRQSPSQELSYEGIVLNPETRTVTSDGVNVELTYKEFELLSLLLHSAGKVLSRDLIMEHVWDYDYSGSSRTLDMHIKTLRQKLGSSGQAIQTIRNVGYRIGE